MKKQYKIIKAYSNRIIKEYKIIIVILVIAILGGTGFFLYRTSSTNKAVKKGIELISQKQYEKALISFDLILEDDSDNTKASELKDMVEKYLEAKKLFDEGKLTEAKSEIESINKSYSNYNSLKEDINALENKINEEINSNKDIDNNINKVRELINENNFDEAKRVIENLEKQELDENQKQQISDLKGRVTAELEKIDIKNKSENSANQDINKNSDSKSNILKYLNGVEERTPEFDGSVPSANKIYSNWDDALNFVWSKLKEDLPQGEFNKLKEKQIQWISEKESAAKQASINSGADAGSQMYRMLGTLEAADLTKERCYQLAAYFK
ncbi:lysozyme inhibitor LprI family protein [Clostridium sardiniense]|uniref:lysozyme inhibitor LprI family protein n=1 Tax=Clostridium sardiniense TaxID=29369 RepID=UPI003D32DBED